MHRSWLFPVCCASPGSALALSGPAFSVHLTSQSLEVLGGGGPAALPLSSVAQLVLGARRERDGRPRGDRTHRGVPKQRRGLREQEKSGEGEGLLGGGAAGGGPRVGVARSAFSPGDTWTLGIRNCGVRGRPERVTEPEAAQHAREVGAAPLGVRGRVRPFPYPRRVPDNPHFRRTQIGVRRPGWARPGARPEPWPWPPADPRAQAAVGAPRPRLPPLAAVILTSSPSFCADSPPRLSPWRS